uniref:CdiA toxin EC869-like domain-containing protein n=1 Tax=Ralstonia syzygii R24 TaxID=907261 RepID=G3AAB3_9RALS|nr:hypothetical protein [Ralstonia syzygii]CCA88261.1 hypothetical protein RALSY_mp10809 [Ralstonia syzygii R24]
MGELPGQAIARRLPFAAKFQDLRFYNPEALTAISAKTLDTTTASRVANPSQVFSSLKGNVDSVVNFEEWTLSGRVLSSDMIAARELRVAVPLETTPAQWEQISRAIQYGKDQGVKVIVTTSK